MLAHWVLNKRLPLVIVITLLLTLLFASPVMASRIISDDTVVIESGEVIDDDVIFMGNKLIVDGTIKGDLVATGQEIVVNGTIEGDLLASGMSITLDGEVMDDMRAAGYLVKLTDNAVVGDEALLAGFSVETDAGSIVNSDVLMAGYQALLAGSIGGDLKASANGVQIDGTIDGDADLEVGDPADNVNVATYMAFNPQVPSTASVPAGLTVGSRAVIAGDLTYSSLGEGDIASGAVEGLTSTSKYLLWRRPLNSSSDQHALALRWGTSPDSLS